VAELTYVGFSFLSEVLIYFTVRLVFRVTGGVQFGLGLGLSLG